MKNCNHTSIFLKKGKKRAIWIIDLTWGEILQKEAKQGTTE